MIQVTRALVSKWIESLLHIHDSPKRTAAAFAVGVFWGFSPFLGLHTVLALICAFVFGLNRIAVVVGVYVNLPWFLAPYYSMATLAGATVLGVHVPADFGQRLQKLLEASIFTSVFWSELFDVMRPLLWPYHVGSLAGAVVLSLLAYYLALPAIVAGRKHIHLRHHAAGSTEANR